MIGRNLRKAPMIVDILMATLLLGGSLLILVAAIGLQRLPDIFCRSHALGKAMTLGITLMLLALGLELGLDTAGIKIVLIITFQFVTIPIASHLLSLIAWEKKLPRWKEKPVDFSDKKSE